MRTKFGYLLIIMLALLALVACGPADADGDADTGDVVDAGEDMVDEEPADDGDAAEAPAVEELNILWAQWDPADYLQQIGNDYEAETGVKINIVQEPWASFQDRFFTEMAAGGTAWDMVVGDSPWLGAGSQQGHYEDMTEFLTSTGVADTVTPATMTYYGESPTGSGTYWAYPTEGDADGWAYRKDLFEDPDEMAAFEEEYGYPLAVPEDYDQFMDIANFFTRPDDGLYGVAIYGQNGYDSMVMGVENTMFAWGADWKDDSFNVQGVVNSDRAVEALDAYKQMWDCCSPPGMASAFFNETNDAFISGQAAMAMNFFAFFPALANPDVNPYAESTGFFANPAGPYGDRGAALGGQGMSIISYISDERKEAAKDFIEWFAQEDVQARWAELGGYTCNANVLESDAFLNATPFNPAFAETMTIVKDFWNIPAYDPLLQSANRAFGAYIIEGQGTAQETMDQVAEEHHQILVDEGVIEE